MALSSLIASCWTFSPFSTGGAPALSTALASARSASAMSWNAFESAAWISAGLLSAAVEMMIWCASARFWI